MIKKIFLTLALTFVLVGCGNNPPNLEDRVAGSVNDENTVLVYNGIIEPLEIDVYQQGTHQIRTDDNELIIIQSQDYDLGKFLDKQVEITGYFAEQVGNSEPVLNITEVKLEDGELIGEFGNYENRLFGLGFDYPKIWELVSRAGGVSLVDDDYTWVKIEVFIDKSDLDSFVDAQENEEGTPITIATQRSVRYADGESVRIYIPNPPKKKIYRIIFNEDKKDVDGNKELFYEVLESFKLIYKTVRTGDKCGGKDDIKCDEEYICELSSTKEDASGVCVSVDSEGEDQDCPFIPPPLECKDYRVSEYSKTTRCPSRYKCADDGVSSLDNSSDEEDVVYNVDSLVSTIKKYQDKIIPIRDVNIIQYEITEGKSLVAVVYEDEDMKYKTLYSFAPFANEYNFIEKAHFEVRMTPDSSGEGNEKDWRLISGKDLQSGLDKSVIKANVSGEDSDPREVDSDMRLYENQFKDFSLEYPKNWYYRSFGAINNTRWIVGFADESVEYLSDAVITVSIMDEEKNALSGMYKVIRSRDDDTLFAIEGEEDLKEIIDLMADSIE